VILKEQFEKFENLGILSNFRVSLLGGVAPVSRFLMMRCMFDQFHQRLRSKFFEKKRARLLLILNLCGFR
jgi:hypothetical protein